MVRSLNTSPTHTLSLDFLSCHPWEVNRHDWYYLLDYLRLPHLRKFDLRCCTVSDGTLRFFLKNNSSITHLALYGQETQPKLYEIPPEALEVVEGTSGSVEGVLSPVPPSQRSPSRKNILPNLRRVYVQQSDHDTPEDLQRALSALGLLNEDPSTPKNVALALGFQSVPKCAQFVVRSQDNASYDVVFPEQFLTCVTRLEVLFLSGENLNLRDERGLSESMASWLGKFTHVEEVTLDLYARGGMTSAKEDEERAVRSILKHAPGIKRARVTGGGEMHSTEEWKKLYP